MITEDRRAFREALPDGGRLLGLDVGTKTIGTALCDAGWSFASPATLIRRTKFGPDKELVADLATAQQVFGIVMGLPLNLDGSDSRRTQSTRAFARNLAQKLPLPIAFWDERLSTSAVTRMLIEADTRRDRRAEVVDKLAASYILQGALEKVLFNGADVDKSLASAQADATALLKDYND